ncbi:MAG: hypothetical protein ACM358_08055 [Gemmatimonadota bacterium]
MRALTRNTLLAMLVAVLVSLALPSSYDFLDAFTIAFSFCYVGYLVEKTLLMLPGIETGGGRIVRVLGWFAGGLWCYVLGRWALVAYGKDTSALPSLIWGGLFFVGLQFLVHGILQATGKPNFYSGQLQETS